MKYQMLFSGKNKKNITYLLTAELAKRIARVKQKTYLILSVYDIAFKMPCFLQFDPVASVENTDFYRFISYSLK